MKMKIIFAVCILTIIMGIIWKTWIKTKEMSDEEYIGLFQENKEDFLVVAQILADNAEYVDIDLSKKEITGNHEYSMFTKYVNEEFFDSLQSIKELKVIHSIHSGDREILFSVNNLNKNYRGGYLCTSQERMEGTFCTKIEGNWYLEILPNT